MPKVSICIPTYENAGEVKRLLGSVRQQTFQDIEVIVTDDSRGKEIENQIRVVQESDEKFGKKIKYTHNEKRLGHIFNWNAALEKATGEYIKIMFSDDWFTFPDSLEKLVRLLDTHPRAGLAFCGSMQVSPGRVYARKPEVGYRDRLKTDYRYLFISNQIGAPSDTIYRNVPGIAFDEKSNWASDVFLYMEILKRNPLFASTDEPLISIGIHENQYTESFSEKDERIYQDYRYLYRKYRLEESRLCKQYFLESYIIRFSRGLQEALANGYTGKEYRQALVHYYRTELIPCYKNALLGKIFPCKSGGKAKGK